MSWQRIELNMIPDTKVLPVVHASQFDSNRSISFQMFTGEDEWTIPEGLTIELHCRKVDDNIVTLAPLSVDGSVITFITTEQLTACSGQNKCELSFIDADDLVIGSLNFILDVEPDPLKGGLTSASSIYDLTQQIEDITQEVIGEDYYDKTEVDALLADKADVSDLPDMSQYYTKTATDTLLNAKADAATTYTKSETDSLLSAKANTADLATVATTGDYDDLINKPTIPAAQVQSDYTQADTTAVDYIKNKPDINAMIASALLAVMPVDSATGNPCTFDADIATSLVGLSADIVASGGNGTPSTPIPIVGYSSLNLTHCGVNLWNEETELGSIAWSSGEPYNDNTKLRFKDFVKVNANTEYYIVCPSAYDIHFYETNGTYIGATYKTGNSAITIPNKARYIRIALQPSYGTTYNHDISINYPSSVTTYQPHNGTSYLVQFGQTVYGGVYDANVGKVVVTKGYIDLSTLDPATLGSTPVFYKQLTNVKVPASNSDIAEVIAECYTPIRYNGVAGTVDTVAINTSGYIYVNTGSALIIPSGIAVFTLATPIEIDVSSISVDAVSGVNNIVSDCGGDVTASYKVSIQKYVDDHV